MREFFGGLTAPRSPLRKYLGNQRCAATPSCQWTRVAADGRQPTGRPRRPGINGWWPAHHRINAGNACFYRAYANSRIEVTPRVTPAVAVAEKASRGAQLAHCEHVFGPTGRTSLVARVVNACVWPEAVRRLAKVDRQLSAPSRHRRAKNFRAPAFLQCLSISA